MSWERMRDALEADGWDTHAPALPFHDLPRGAPAPAALARVTLADYVAALRAFIATLPANPVLVGHSMGGLLAQLVAVETQPPALVLLCPAASAATPGIGLDPVRTLWSVLTRWGWWRTPTLLSEAGARFGVYNGVPEAEILRGLSELTWDSGRVMAQIAFPWADPARGANVDYARLAMPALVLTGAEDRIAPSAIARATARNLPGPVRFEPLAGVGHWLFHDPVGPQVTRLLREFLAPLR